ncbi:putative phage abortive infection protein [Shimia sp. Alg240-R146]|uniref:putative phage abortive infection protein n=1 Tax=Shimia sp. Alg240-R146 TaxID=2993449 RepID=UPI0022E52C6D|nr:putative phage abortive infection protein [Shimia sp. Alg240-R146]
MRNTPPKHVWKSGPMVLGYVLTILIGLFWAFSFVHIGSSDSECASNFCVLWNSAPNEIGDSFAGLFGSLAFVWIVVTVLIQSLELREQRLEFSNMTSQMELQRFDNTFFAALDGIETAIRDIDLNSAKHGQTVGRDCFRVFYTRFKKDFRERQSKGHKPDLALELAYRSFWNSHQLELSQYFRVLESVLKLVAEQRSEHRKIYFDIIRFRLSDQELLLTFYHVISGQSADLKVLCEQAVFFEHLPTVRLLEYDHYKKVDSKAFGNNPLKDASDFKNPANKVKT